MLWNIEMLHEKYDIFCLASSRPKILLALPGLKCFAYTFQDILRLVYQNIFFLFYFKVTATACNITIAYFILPISVPLFEIPSKCFELFAQASISRYFFWQKYNLFPFLFSRWHPRPILRSVAAVWIRRFSTRIELPLPRRLRWSWEAIFRNHLLVTGVQNKVSRKLFPTQRQPRVRQYKQNIRILWWM